MSAITYPFVPNTERYEGVRPINIYALRTLFFLIAVFVSFDAWSYLLRHQGPWDPMKAVAGTMFASYALLSVIGVFRPLKMLPIMVFIILYKSIWLAVAAYPLWASGQLAGSPVEPMARIFIWVPVLLLAVPWKYFFAKYVMGR